MDFLYCLLKSKTEPRDNVLWENGFPWCHLLRMKSKETASRVNKWGMTVIWANQNLCLISKFQRSSRKKNTWGMTIFWANQNLCLISKFEGSCRETIREGWLFSGPTKICVWFQNSKEAIGKKYVRDDSSLGQPKFVFDFKIRRKL
jgi:hypothetical protein